MKENLREIMAGKKKKEWLKSNIGQFVKEYARKAQRGMGSLRPYRKSDCLAVFLGLASEAKYIKAKYQQAPPAQKQAGQAY
jgi:hypothetical protein